METDENASVHRLEASAPATTGLIIKKKETGDSDSTFKIPKTSLLGLDRLAAVKRQEREKQQRLISFKESEYDDEAALTPRTESSRTPDLANVHKLSRNYRELKDDTPSHGGGVSKKARDRLAEQKGKEKRGVHVSTKDHKKSRKDDDYDRNYDSRQRNHRNRDRDYDRRDRRDSERNYHRDRSDRDNRHHSNRSDKKRSSDSERSLHTPRFKDDPQTPYLGSTSSAPWDDDDDRSTSKRSSWDFPTPKDNRKHSEWSTRSNSSLSRLRKVKIEDDTPRPTPAHKYNAWANDRKKSGATPIPGRRQ